GYLKDKGAFDQVIGVICGKPMNNIYYEDYKRVLCDVIDNRNLSILYNFNIGHCLPRCILPFNCDVTVFEDHLKIV
ncbi:MAG: LD-carboxypeptidase, partial [Solobacterium sp.]|nr:LD-carboxypeptidase [Solobacterium sp.]